MDTKFYQSDKCRHQKAVYNKKETIHRKKKQFITKKKEEVTQNIYYCKIVIPKYNND